MTQDFFPTHKAAAMPSALPSCPELATSYLAKRFSGCVMALNSSAFPEGSKKNMVDCSPGCPTNLTCGSISNLTPAALTLVAKASKASCGNARLHEIIHWDGEMERRWHDA